MKRITIFIFALFAAVLTVAASVLPTYRVRKADLLAYTSSVSKTKQAFRSLPTPSRAGEETVSRAYGIRMYTEESGVTVPDLVSFDVDNPGEFRVEHSLAGHYIRAAVNVDGTYYMIDSDDKLASYRLLSLSLTTGELKTVKEYETLSQEAGLIYEDMTYDPVSKQVYALAFDVQNATGEGENLDIPLGLFTLDLTTGSVTNVGYITLKNIVTLAASPDGYLYGVASDGGLWDINKSNAALGDEQANVGFSPSSLQSMAFDMESGDLYWAAFYITQEGESSANVGHGLFAKFTNNPDEGLFYGKVADFPNNEEFTGLYIDSNPLPKAAPEAVSDLAVTPAEGGKGEATLTWKNPANNIGGTALSEAFSVKIYRNNEAVGTLENQQAGASASFVDKNVPSGTVDYKVVAVNAAGEGRPVYVSKYIGRDLPGTVVNLKATKADGSNTVTVSWKAPEAGKNGGWFDAASLKYKIVRFPDEKVLAEASADASFTDNTITKMAGYSYQVTPLTSDGEGLVAESDTLFAGPALTLPFSCNFSTDELFRLWKVRDNDKDGQTWFLSSNYAGTKDFFMKYFPENSLDPTKAADDWFISAPVAVEAGKSYVLRYAVRLMGGATGGSLFPSNYSVTMGQGTEVADQTKVLGKYDDQENEMVFEDRAVTFTVDKSGEYNFGFQVRNLSPIQITNIRIEEIHDVDMRVDALTGPASAQVDNQAVYEVTVYNNGAKPCSGYTVKLVDADNNTLSEFTSQDELAAQTSRKVALGWTPAKGGAVVVKAAVSVPGDGDTSNDISATVINVNVLGSGEWFDAVPGKTSASGFVPFSFRTSRSTTQTIYQGSELASGKGTISGIKYYYTATREANDIPVKIYLANTDLSNFADNTPVADDNFTLVYDGKMNLPVASTLSEVAFIFNTPFEYTGGNLCVKAEQEGTTGVRGVFFYSRYSSDDANNYSLIYGTQSADDQSDLKSMKDVAKASFFVSGAASGVNGISSVKVNVYPNPTSGLLHIDGEYDSLRIYNVSGRLVGQYAANTSIISLEHLAKGIYFAEILSNSERFVEKIVLQ